MEPGFRSPLPTETIPRWERVGLVAGTRIELAALGL